MQNKKSKNKEIFVQTKKFFCDGTNHNLKLGHPRIYLQFEGQRTSCHYCNQIFIYKPNNILK